MIVKMAWRNLFRHKKRTVLTLITMTIGVMFSIATEGLNSGMYLQVRETLINTDVGYYKIYGKDYYEERDLNEIIDFPISNWELLEEKLANTNYSPRLVFTGSITDTRNELNTTFISVDKSMENNVFNRDSYMVKGDFLLDENKVVIGSDIARLLNLDIGSEIVMIGRTADKSINAYDREVGGIIRTGNPILDSNVIFLPLSFAREFTGADFFNDIVIGQELNTSQEDALHKMNIDFIYLDEELKEVNQITNVRKRIFSMVSIAILTMAGLSIANTMLMAMLERRKEIGIMMANGMNRLNILKLFLIEGTISGGIGGFLGFIFGSIIVLYYQSYGMHIGNMDELGVNIPMADRLFFNYSLQSSLYFLFIGFIFALVAGYYPAYKATKMEPVEVISNH